MKNIFKKVAKIPPGELQDASLVVKWRDETEIVSGGVGEMLRVAYCVLRGERARAPRVGRDNSSAYEYMRVLPTRCEVFCFCEEDVPSQVSPAWSNQMRPKMQMDHTGSKCIKVPREIRARRTGEFK